MYSEDFYDFPPPVYLLELILKDHKVHLNNFIDDY